MRPNMFNVSGKAMDDSLYSVVSSPHSTFVLDHGRWTKAKNAEEGFALITGTGGVPGCAVPIAMLHLSWSQLRHLRETPNSDLEVAPDVVNGRDAFKITANKPQSTSVWIDARSYLIVRVLTSSAGKVQADTVYDSPVIDKPISAKVFSRPRKSF